MDEAKTLVHMSISSIFAAMFLAAAVGLIGVGYMVWSYFSRQEAANQRMADYANYTAFDNTTIRGQEVLGLLESDLDLFVIFCDGKSNNHSIDNMNTITPKFVYYDNVTGVSDFKLDSIAVTTNVNVTCENALKRIKQQTNKIPSNLFSDNAKVLNNKSHSQLIEFLTDTTHGMGAIRLDNNGNVFNTNSYAAFKSTLVYAEDGTTDVVGIILVRADAYVEFEGGA